MFWVCEPVPFYDCILFEFSREHTHRHEHQAIDIMLVLSTNVKSQLKPKLALLLNHAYWPSSMMCSGRGPGTAISCPSNVPLSPEPTSNPCHPAAGGKKAYLNTKFIILKGNICPKVKQSKWNKTTTSVCVSLYNLQTTFPQAVSWRHYPPPLRICRLSPSCGWENRPQKFNLLFQDFLIIKWQIQALTPGLPPIDSREISWRGNDVHSRWI